MSGPSIRIALSGFAGADNPEPGGGVAHALRDGWNGRLELDALGYDAWMTAAWQPGLIDNVHMLPEQGGGDRPFVERILALHEDREFDAWIPNLDLEVLATARYIKWFYDAGLKTLIPGYEALTDTAKVNLPAFCHKHGIATPITIHVVNLEQLAFYADQFGYPLMVKGTIAGARKVHNAEQAQKEARELNKKWGNGVLLQQIIPGDEYNVAMVARHDGSLLADVAIRKLAVTEEGKGAMAAVVDDPDIAKTARRILKRLNWAGPLELEMIREPDTGRTHLIEVNCRFPSWIHLSAWAGCNLPVLLAEEILGRGKATAPLAKAGAGFVRDIREVALPIENVRTLQDGRSCKGTPCGNSPPAPKKDGPRVAVTGVSSFNTVMAGLGVAESLKASGEAASVFGLGYDSFDSGVYRPDLFDAVFKLPPFGDSGALLDGLTKIHKQDPFDVIVPCLDIEIPKYIEIADGIAKLGVGMLIPVADAHDRTRKLPLFLEQNRSDWGGFRIPASCRLVRESDIGAAIEQLGLPMIVKGAVSGATRVETAKDARLAYAEHRNDDGVCLAQECINGDEFAVATVCGRDSEMINTVTIKKQFTDEGGSTWGAIHVPQMKLEKSLGHYLRDLGWVGPVEGEFIRDALTEEFYLLEINPRHTAWISYAKSCGHNLPLTGVMAAMDSEPPEPNPNGKTVFMRSCAEFPVAPQEIAAFSTAGEVRHG